MQHTNMYAYDYDIVTSFLTIDIKRKESMVKMNRKRERKK